jgi:hypothetical protein
LIISRLLPDTRLSGKSGKGDIHIIRSPPQHPRAVSG